MIKPIIIVNKIVTVLYRTKMRFKMLRAQVRACKSIWKCRASAELLVNNLMEQAINGNISTQNIMPFIEPESTADVGNMQIVMSYVSGYGLVPLQSQGNLMDFLR